MCDPITIGAMALSTAGGIGTAKTNSDYVDAVNAENRKAFEMTRKARLDEQARQAQFDADAARSVDQTHGAVTREAFDKTKDAAAENFAQALAVRPDVLNAPVVDDSASDAVKTAAAARTSKAAAESRERIKALAALNSYGTTGQSRARTFGEGADFLSMLGGLRRGSLGVSAQEQSIAPAEVTRGDDTFAQLLSGAGMMLGMAGPGMFAGAAPAASGPTMTSLRPKARPW